MAGIVTGPFSMFRKSDIQKPLHSRWGDSSISVPTDGSWSQYDNPHNSLAQSSYYGPGYVPGIAGREQSSHTSNEEHEEETRSNCSMSSEASRRGSLPLRPLRSDDVSELPTSHSKQHGDDSQYAHKSPADFAYKPIQQHYPTEVENSPHKPGNRFKYIPTSGRYLQEIRAPAARSHSSGSRRNSHLRCDSYPESITDRRFDRNPRPAVRKNTCDNDLRGLRSSIVNGPEGSRQNFGLPSRRNTSPFVPADRKRDSSKPFTMAMVPDPDQLYD